MADDTRKKGVDGRADEGSFKQTDKPWKDAPEKEQDSRATNGDLEKWRDTSTH